MKHDAQTSRPHFGTCLMLIAALLCWSGAAGAADATTGITVYDESSYTEYVEATMGKLEALYLDFCNKCDSDPATAVKAREEFLTTVRDLMQHMNGKFDELDPKKGAALSPTETLVSIHALTMLVDIMAASQMERWSEHPYIQ
jgi:hypothetical protein